MAVRRFGIVEGHVVVKAVTAKKEGPDLTGALKEQLAVLSVLVLFAGCLSTDTYYRAFGFRYQIFDFSIEHLIYRGVTALLSSWTLWVAYIVSVAWLSFGPAALVDRFPKSAKWMPLATSILVFCVGTLTYYAAISSGARTAQADLTGSQSSLPVIQNMTDKDGKDLPVAGFRLAISDKDTVVYFKPAPNDQVPQIHIRRREDLGEIVVSR